MNAVKLLGGGDVYIKLNAMNETAFLAFGMINAGEHAGRYTQKDADFLFPLLEKQSYINKLDLWRNETVDYDLGTHYKFTTGPKGWQGNQTECYGLVCNLDIEKHRKALNIIQHHGKSCKRINSLNNHCAVSFPHAQIVKMQIIKNNTKF